MRITEKGLPCRAIHQQMTNCISCSWAVLHGTAVLAVSRSIIRAKKNQGKYALEKSILWKKEEKAESLPIRLVTSPPSLPPAVSQTNSFAT